MVKGPDEARKKRKRTLGWGELGGDGKRRSKSKNLAILVVEAQAGTWGEERGRQQAV